MAPLKIVASINTSNDEFVDQKLSNSEIKHFSHSCVL